MGFNMPSIDFSDDKMLDGDSITLPIFGGKISSIFSKISLATVKLIYFL
jgi:hypothetical protein